MESNVELINLSASARLIFQLGEQLISDEIVALMELIKNAYDADATQVSVNINSNEVTPYGIGKIVVEDNGNGMIPSIIKDSFLRLSTNFKKVNRISPYYKRLMLGDKGVGRLSLQKLGWYIRVITTPRIDRIKELIKPIDMESFNQFNSYEVIIDWNNFLADKDFQEIKNTVKSYKVDEKKYGTTIEIYNIRNPNMWILGQKDESKIRNEILTMINPFIKKKNSKFSVCININGKQFTNEKIDEDIIYQISDIRTDIEFKNWVLSLKVERKKRYYNRQKLKRIKDMLENGFEILAEKEPQTDILHKEYLMDFRNISDVKDRYPILKKLSFELVNNILAYPGDFEGVLYGTDFSSENKTEFINLINAKEFGEDIKLYAELNNIWKSANGFYLFRKDFRILPYGAKDWLGFTNKSQTDRATIYKEHTISGYINLDGETSENLTEQTNRQGIVEDEYGKNFFKLLKDVIVEILFKEDVDFRDGFSFKKNKEAFDSDIIITRNGLLEFKRVIVEEELKDQALQDIQTVVEQTENKTNYSPEEEIKKILFKNCKDNQEVDKIINSSDPTIKMLINSIMDALSKGLEVNSFITLLNSKVNDVKYLDAKVEQKNKQTLYLKNKQIEEFQGFLPIVGQGIIVESLTHELHRIEENIKTYARKTRDSLEDGQILGLIDELIDNQENIISETVYLGDQLSHLEPTYRKNRKIFDRISLKSFLMETYCNNGPMSAKAKGKQISVNLLGEDFKINANKGFLITVFDNLFLNSLYWLDNVNFKEINFEILASGKVMYWDSGPGIHEKIENELFEPFQSMKDDGRGLGLFIVSELLASMNAKIGMIDERRNNRLYKFVIEFDKILEG